MKLLESRMLKSLKKKVTVPFDDEDVEDNLPGPPSETIMKLDEPDIQFGSFTETPEVRYTEKQIVDNQRPEGISVADWKQIRTVYYNNLKKQ